MQKAGGGNPRKFKSKQCSKGGGYKRYNREEGKERGEKQ